MQEQNFTFVLLTVELTPPRTAIKGHLRKSGFSFSANITFVPTCGSWISLHPVTRRSLLKASSVAELRRFYGSGLRLLSVCRTATNLCLKLSSSKGKFLIVSCFFLLQLEAEICRIKFGLNLQQISPFAA